MKNSGIVFLLAFLWVIQGQAAIDTYAFEKDTQRQQFTHLLTQLRCPKCQNQDLADSDAPIAADLRNQIYHQVLQGNSDEQIVGYLVDRYGNFVRYSPPWNQRTWLLWLFPFILLGLAAPSLLLLLKHKRTTLLSARPLSKQELQRLAQLLDKHIP